MFQLEYSKSFQNPGEKSGMTEKAFPGKVGYLAVKASPALFLSALDQHLDHGAKNKVLLQSPVHFRIKKVLLEKYLGKVFQNCELCFWNLLSAAGT